MEMSVVKKCPLSVALCVFVFRGAITLLPDPKF